ncbi:MAG TPA: leishmanolysin-related zinc metalloendopeptidase [Gemmatimonadales bacterium]|nr:leishmanolysin-related zinc metalloendopeptidase [Gemmatimonadales bacterium]HRZ08997.1 leishmanolysin-related zinc metalloendopeptidase [Gemmatimonadales bacterium]
MRVQSGMARAGLAAVAAGLVFGCSGDGGSGPSQEATTIAVASGSVQNGTVGTALPTPIGVRVTDAGGDPVAGVAVTFAVTDGGGAVSAAAPVTTNAQGEASTTWTIGTVAGVNNNVATATAAGLSGSPVTFRASGVAGPGVAVVPVSGNNQNAVVFTGTAAPLVAQVNDAYGNPVVGTTVTWTISGGGSGSTGATVTDALGRTSATRTVGGTISGYITTASLPIGGTAFFDFVTLGTAVASSYNVEVVFLTPVTASQRTAFLDAAARWSSIVVQSFPPDQVTADANSCGSNTPAIDQLISSVLIYATVAPIDGPGQILGGASPCWVRLPGLTTLVGDMTFDSADLPSLELNNVLKPVILHEMGHVLGFGSLWNCPAIPGCTKPPLMVYGGTDSTHFVGVAANNYYTAAGGLIAFPSLYAVPVENTGGPGTADGHWRETVMTNELMTGYIALGASPLSAITVGSLADIGYSVNYTTAEAYTFTAPPSGAPAMVQGIQMKELAQTGPIHGIDRQGRITRVR